MHEAPEGESLDAELLYRVGRGDQRAFSSLYRRHERRIYAVALSMTRSPWDAEDVVSAAFLELWRKRNNVRIVEDSVLPWLLTVVTYCSKNKIRTQVRYARLLRKIPRDEPQPDHADEVGRMMDAEAISTEVQTALRHLNARDAGVLLLCIVEEMSIADAARALGVPEGTVKSRLSRAKARLRASLGDVDGLEEATL